MMKLSKKIREYNQSEYKHEQEQKSQYLSLFLPFTVRPLAYLTLLKGIGATFDMTYAEYIKSNSNIIPFFQLLCFHHNAV